MKSCYKDLLWILNQTVVVGRQAFKSVSKRDSGAEMMAQQFKLEDLRNECSQRLHQAAHNHLDLQLQRIQHTLLPPDSPLHEMLQHTQNKQITKTE